MEALEHLWRRIKGCCLPLVFIALLATLLLCVGLGLGLIRLAEAADEPALDVILVIDQSGSLWELGGVGTDPEMLRMEGARLFASYLGVDGSADSYRLGVVYFGSQARLVVPLTSLTGENNERQTVLAALTAPPEPMGWTDVNAALALAYQELYLSERSHPDHAKAVILFTDGRPQTEALNTPAANHAYLGALTTQVQSFGDQDAAFYTILLGGAVSDADPLAASVYRPFWVQLAEANVGVHLFDARDVQDLADIYHAIVTQLHHSRSQGTVVRETVADKIEATVRVASGWQRATFLIYKSHASLQITLLQPDGRPLQSSSPGVNINGQESYEVWSIARPTSGLWRVQAAGQGVVAVWLDYQLLPVTATPRPTSTPTVTVTPSSTPTRAPVAAPTDLPATDPVEEPLATTPSVNPGPAWGWLVGSGLAALIVAGSCIAGLRRVRPGLDGVLRMVQAPTGQPVGQTWDLSRLRKRTVTLGSNIRCDIHLPGDPQIPAEAAQIRSARNPETGGPLLTQAALSGLVKIAGQRARPSQPLDDGDTIEIGSCQLRYENLNLRRQQANRRPSARGQVELPDWPTTANSVKGDRNQ